MKCVEKEADGQVAYENVKDQIARYVQMQQVEQMIQDEKDNMQVTAGTIMLGAHSSMGKSTLALQMAQNISAQGIPVFYYSMEMRKVNIVAKALSREVFVQSDHQKSISGNDLLSAKRRQTFCEDTWKLIEDARQIVKEEARNLYIVEDFEAASVSGLSIYEDVTKLAEKGNAVVFVDYLQIIAAEVRDESGRRQPYAGDIRTAVDQNVKEDFHVLPDFFDWKIRWS